MFCAQRGSTNIMVPNGSTDIMVPCGRAQLGWLRQETVKAHKKSPTADASTASPRKRRQRRGVRARQPADKEQLKPSCKGNSGSVAICVPVFFQKHTSADVVRLPHRRRSQAHLFSSAGSAPPLFMLIHAYGLGRRDANKPSGPPSKAAAGCTLLATAHRRSTLPDSIGSSGRYTRLRVGRGETF